jgi:hypothetical protein
MIDVLSIQVEEIRTIEAAHLEGLVTTVGEAARHPALLSLNAFLPELDLHRRVDRRIRRVEHERAFPPGGGSSATRAVSPDESGNWFCFCSRLQSMQANSRFSQVHASHQYTDFGR